MLFASTRKSADDVVLSPSFHISTQAVVEEQVSSPHMQAHGQPTKEVT